MSISFLNLMHACFPNISPESTADLYQLVRQKHLYKNWLFSTQDSDILFQGDIVKSLPVLISLDRGKALKKELPALLLNNTCDLQVDNEKPRCEHVSFIPLLPFSEYISAFQNISNHERDARENVITHKFYISIPPNEERDYIADLGLISSVNSGFFHQELKKGGIKKVCSLSINGYYYFLAKLTLHLMRREPLQVKRQELIKES